jgi:hypothetical protein
MARKYRLTTYLFCSVVIFIACLANFAAADTNTQVQDRFDQMADSSASTTTTHDLGFTLSNNTSPLGSIEFQFCSNDPLAGEPCTAPTGFSMSGGILSSQSGNIGFSISPLTSANDLILTSNSAITTPSLSPNLYVISNVVNPADVGTFYVRIYTYSSLDASGTPTETGGVALSTTTGFTISSVVPPFLEFCVGVVIYNSDCSTIDTYIVNMGDFTTNQTSAATSQFLAATNATGGYSVSMTGTTLTSGNNVVASLSTPSPSIIGQDQFGLNLRADNIPNVGSDPAGQIYPLNPSPVISSDYDNINRYTFNDNANLVSIPRPSLPVTYTTSYITNIDQNQPVGVYTTTITYICLANF